MPLITAELARTSAYTLEDQRRMSLAKNYFAWQGRMVRREIGQRVLEIGCGVGNFTEMLLDRDTVIALDKEPACIGEVTERYRGRDNLLAFDCDAESDAEFLKFAEFAPDSCICLNVLEHIKDDAAALRRMKAVLSQHGVIVLIVPAFPALFGPIDENLGHFRRYTMSSLGDLAAEAGLLVTKMRYLNAIGFFAWWANARIFKRKAQSEAQIRFFDRWIVPIASRLEFVPAPFGQSIFAVLQKP